MQQVRKLVSKKESKTVLGIPYSFAHIARLEAAGTRSQAFVFQRKDLSRPRDLKVGGSLRVTSVDPTDEYSGAAIWLRALL